MAQRTREPQKSDGSPEHYRPVRSFVLRAGRLTDGQKRALEELWPLYGIAGGTDAVEFDVLFGNDHPVILEIGFGNGDATWQMARNEPGLNFLGVEVHKPGVGHLLLKIEEYEISNLRIACEDAVELLRQRITSHSLSGVRIYFPDPWPKKRHHKRRIIQPPFVRLLAEKMKPSAILHLATDWAPYAEHMLDVMQCSPAFENLAVAGGRVPRPEWRPQTKYEKRGERLGHEVYDLVFRRRPETERGE
ncbi:MAG: tRNA (guanosine(46)-N7)-methyltransferase TrmB [Xanthomonadales bacterium]|jgi:tRNA (guanine-N7-)-methyltransferase|nr:tRNA (guanosine(46)-N7)-methyltransferase TrmB [Xanthomonadales bacterium]